MSPAQHTLFLPVFLGIILGKTIDLLIIITVTEIELPQKFISNLASNMVKPIPHGY